MRGVLADASGKAKVIWILKACAHRRFRGIGLGLAGMLGKVAGDKSGE